MAVATAIDFKQEVRTLFELFDRQDIKGIKALFSDDPQGVDEISRTWMRGKPALDSYFKELKEMGITNIRSSLRDFAVKHWDDVAVATCMVEQSFSAEGQKTKITAPVTVLYRRHGDSWKIELVHAVALPEAA